MSFFAVPLPAAANFATAPRWRGLRRLSAGVRVHLGVEHQDVDVATGRQDVVEATKADVVRPPVAADDPHTLADEAAGDRGEVAGVGGRVAAGASEQRLQLHDPPALFDDLRLGLLGVFEDCLHEPFAHDAARAGQQHARLRGSASRPRRMPSPNSALSSNSELFHAGPRPSWLTVHGVVGRLAP